MNKEKIHEIACLVGLVKKLDFLTPCFYLRTPNYQVY